MAILNPNKYIRIAYINALEAATGLQAWYKKVPKTVKPTPARYILLDNQTKNETEVSKCDFDWLCTMDINIYSVNAAGYSDAEIVDDYEQQILSVIKPGLTIPYFKNKRTVILESLDLSVETNTQSIDRKLLKMEHWLDNVETSEGLLFFGTSLTGNVLTIEQILAGSSVNYNQLDSIIIPFNNPLYVFNWFWLPYTSNLPDWYMRVNDVNDSGQLGTADGLFKVGVEVEGGTLFMGNYEIPLTDDFRFYSETT